MVKAFWSFLKADILVQFRSGFYLVYLIVSFFYGVLVGFVPAEYQSLVLIFLIFTDPAALGFFLVGAQVLKERQEGSWFALNVSPSFGLGYLLSKGISYWILGLLGSFLVILTAGAQVHSFLTLIFSLGLSSVIYTLLGVALVCGVKTVNEYFFTSTVAFLPLFLPVLGFFPDFQWSIWDAWPMFPELRLLSISLLGHAQGLKEGFGFALDWLTIGLWTSLVLLFAWFRVHKTKEVVI